MTDKIKKLDSITEDVQPEFPTLSRGGYVEDTVDDWLSNHLKEVNEIINYQNYGVDVVDGLEAALEAAQGRINELESATGFVQVSADSSEELETLRAELAAARGELVTAHAAFDARIKELESNPVGEFPSGASETVQASILLQHATQLGQQYLDKAKADGEQIRKDAEATLVDLRVEIEDLEAQRFATYRSLDDFFSQELTKLRENNMFALETGNDASSEDVVVEDIVEDAVVEDDVAGEEDVVEAEVPDAVVPAEDSEAVETAAEEALPSLDEEEILETVETEELSEEDDDSDGISK